MVSTLADQALWRPLSSAESAHRCAGDSARCSSAVALRDCCHLHSYPDHRGKRRIARRQAQKDSSTDANANSSKTSQENIDQEGIGLSNSIGKGKGNIVTRSVGQFETAQEAFAHADAGRTGNSFDKKETQILPDTFTN